MKNDISCEVCMDLLPLVSDGIASADSQWAVEQHIASCERCRGLYTPAPPSPDGQRVWSMLRRKMRSFSLFLMLFGIFFGLGLTAGEDMFYNSILMPVIGAAGYAIFGRRALWLVPVLLFAADMLVFLPQLFSGAGWEDFFSLITWTAIYCLFALAGGLAAWLLHFAFRKEK